ncbi:MAG: hypothetical protein C0612_02135 [Desulfobulbaceae bacterium]|nr:MAG: hypothetical protein C0612_02135 [Desulfobulbaceae bacterium]
MSFVILNLTQYPLEDNFETDIFDNSKSFFDAKTILIDAKKKIQSKSLGGTIPDGFFFDV